MGCSMNTREDVENLKENWVSDPCYDLEEVEGFEEYREELEAFIKHQEKKWEEQRVRVLEWKADKLGIPGNLFLAQYVMQLELRLDKLEAHVYPNYLLKQTP
jgi:hypothetical protein